MVPIKSKEQFFEPDPTNEAFPGLTLEKHYEIVSKYCVLHDGVPENVRSYFNSVVMLYLYGWLYYPFFTFAGFLSTFTVEMALRHRFPCKKLNKKGRDPRYIRDLLNEAKKNGLLRDEDFPSLKNRRANAKDLNQRLAETQGVQVEAGTEEPFADTLITWLPRVRNDFAHPKMHSILPPGPALDPVILTSEIVNALWPNPKPQA
jgi:hypothetical protein